MSEKTEYTTLFGAKVKEPIEMPDDILKVSKHAWFKDGMALANKSNPHYQTLLISQDAITTTLKILKEKPSSDSDDSAVIQEIKDHMDKTWKPNWHVVYGRSFGSRVTHEANRFIYFYVEDKAIMIYKA